jgi:hypothetical protein
MLIWTGTRPQRQSGQAGPRAETPPYQNNRAQPNVSTFGTEAALGAQACGTAAHASCGGVVGQMRRARESAPVTGRGALDRLSPPAARCRLAEAVPGAPFCCVNHAGLGGLCSAGFVV